MPLVKKITCAKCDYSFLPLDTKDSMCPDCLHINKIPELKLNKKKKPIDAFIELYPPDKEGEEWIVVPSPFKPYKEGV